MAIRFKMKPFWIDSNQITKLIENNEDLKEVFQWYTPDELLNFKKSLEIEGKYPTFGANSDFKGDRLIEFLMEKE